MLPWPASPTDPPQARLGNHHPQVPGHDAKTSQGELIDPRIEFKIRKAAHEVTNNMVASSRHGPLSLRASVLCSRSPYGIYLPKGRPTSHYRAPKISLG